MSDKLREEFEKETSKSAFQDVGGYHYCARDEYAEWLETHGYMDSDWWAEQPTAVDRFLEEQSRCKDE